MSEIASPNRWSYYKRIFQTYVAHRGSNLTFWHEKPEVNERATYDKLGPYYMPFAQKADYAGPFDPSLVPMLDYSGTIGRQYNPIAIAQYGLAHYNRFKITGHHVSLKAFVRQADWLVENLEPNAYGVLVWNHQFDWEYKQTLKAPWYSGLAQGQGISLLLRAWDETKDNRYMECAHKAFQVFLRLVAQGGVTYNWSEGDIWFEEYITEPPTHILNGFIWALWGVYDYLFATGKPEAKELFQKATESLKKHLKDYDTDYWSLYDLSQSGRLRMLASPFYHRLHITQLKVMERLAKDKAFGEVASRWDSYTHKPWNLARAVTLKSVFKILHY
ncbi:MAG: hypothetical protein HY663_02780 [Chloroflexi bacterium]|nr:hypothetical protein [Chloroflexota bacterium]